MSRFTSFCVLRYLFQRKLLYNFLTLCFFTFSTESVKKQVLPRSPTTANIQVRGSCLPMKCVHSIVRTLLTVIVVFSPKEREGRDNAAFSSSQGKMVSIFSRKKQRGLLQVQRLFFFLPLLLQIHCVCCRLTLQVDCCSTWVSYI